MKVTDTTCWTLVHRAAGGDAESRERFAHVYAPVIRSYLATRWRLPSGHDDVSDGLQEVLLQCLKEGGALERVDSTRAGGFRAFLYGVVRNVAGTVEDRRRRWRQQSGDQPLDELPVDDASLSQIFDRAFAEALAREARLLMATRAGAGTSTALRLRALELMYERGLPPRRIAEELGLPVTSVYPLMTRARREYSAILLEVLAAHHPEDGRERLLERCREVFAAL